LSAAHRSLFLDVRLLTKFIEPLRIVNLTLHYTFVFAAAIGVFKCVKQIRRLFRVRRDPAMSPAS
jgi:hypothetical protein